MEPEVYYWFRNYYHKWLQFCENQRWITDGRGAKHSRILLPFQPYGQVSAIPIHNLLTTFIDTQICDVTSELPETPGYHKPLGFEGSMITVVRKDNQGSDEPIPYVLLEPTYGGIITGFKLFKDKTWGEIEPHIKKYDIQRKDPYIKTVSISFLRRMYELDQQWLNDGNSAKFILDWFANLFSGIDDGSATVDPVPQILKNISNIRDKVELGDIDFWDTVKKLSHLMPKVVIKGRGGDIDFDFGGKFTVIVNEDALLALLDGLKSSKTLEELYRFLIDYLTKAIKAGWIEIQGFRWFSKFAAKSMRRRVNAVSKKLQVATDIMADPFRFLLIVENKALMVVLVNGLLHSVKQVELLPGEDKTLVPLKKIWLECCHKYEFIHLSVRLKPALTALLDLSLGELLEHYPENDFVDYIVNEGFLNIFFCLLFPFLNA